LNLWEDFVIVAVVYSGSCQGVIALNMEDGTLHRFHAASTILATGVLLLLLFFFPCWGVVNEIHLILVKQNYPHTLCLSQGYGRAYFSATSAHTCTGDGNAMVARAGLPLEVCFVASQSWSSMLTCLVILSLIFFFIIFLFFYILCSFTQQVYMALVASSLKVGTY